MAKPQKNIPELRFPDFEKDGEWKNHPLSRFVESLDAGVSVNSGDKPARINEVGVLKTSCVSNGKFDFLENKVVTESKEIKRLKESVCKNTIIISRMNTPALVGANAFVEKSFNNLYLPDRLWSAKPKSDTVMEFISYILSSRKGRKALSAMATGTSGSMKNITKTDVLNLHFMAPSQREQQKIADCLSSLDELISAHQEKLDTLKDHKKGLLQNLFPQEGQKVPNYRFPEFSLNLAHFSFNDLGDIKIGLTHKPEYIESGIPFLSSKNISNGFIDFEDIQFISQEKFDSMPKSTKPQVGDILFTRVGSNLGNPIILEKKIDFGIFVSLGFFRTNKNAYNYYIKYWMETDYFWKQVNQKVAGGAKNNLNTTWLKEFELFIPDLKEQQKIADCLSSLDNLISAQTEKIEQLQEHKKGLMQGLFPNQL